MVIKYHKQIITLYWSMFPHKISILVILRQTACIVPIQSIAVDVAMVVGKQYVM